MQNERRIHKSGSRNTGYSGGRLCSQHPGNCKKSKRNEPGGRPYSGVPGTLYYGVYLPGFISAGYSSGICQRAAFKGSRGTERGSGTDFCGSASGISWEAVQYRSGVKRR